MVKYGSLVKRLRRRPLTAETGVRFPYELLLAYVHEQKSLRGCDANLGIFVLKRIILC